MPESNPNLGKMPVDKATYEWIAANDPDRLASVYNWQDARAELLWRLNAWAQGKNPGEPVCWPGVRGFR
jgi:hypothetical protein